MNANNASQSRLHFDLDKLLQVGTKEIFCFPGYGTNDWFARLDIFERRVAKIFELKKTLEKEHPGLKIHVMGYTASHPEGTNEIPPPIRQQTDIYGKPLIGYACVLDENWKRDCIERYKIIARFPFEKVFLDDDFKDGLCFCEHHAALFSKYIGNDIPAQTLRQLFLKEDVSREEIALRKKYYEFKKANLLDFARQLESEIHSLNKTLSIGQCVNAKRFNDLSGRRFTELLEIWDTPDAPSFVRLPGEYYSTFQMDVIQSIGWHLYYDEIIDKRFDRVAEVTINMATFARNPHQFVQEIKAHHSFGIKRILFAWTEYFDNDDYWTVLNEHTDEIDQFHALPVKGRSWGGLPVASFENKAACATLDEVLECESIKGFQVLEMLGFPCLMQNKINVDDEFFYLSGPLSADCAGDITGSLENGAHILFDVRSAQSLLAIDVPEELKRFTIGANLERVQKETLIASGTFAHDVDNFPSGTIKKLLPADDNVELLSELHNVDEEFIGYGALQFPVLEGTVTVLAHNIPLIKKSAQTAFYQKYFKTILISHLTGKLPYVESTLGICPFCYDTENAHRIVIVNINDHTMQFSLTLPNANARFIDAVTKEPVNPRDMTIGALGVRVLEDVG